MTDTAAAVPTPTHLVVLREGFTDSSRGMREVRDETGNTSEDGRTFYAVEGDAYGPGWYTLIVPTSDPRSAGMHTRAVGEDGVEYARWHVPTRDIETLTPLTPTDEPTFTREDVERARAEGRREAEREFDRWKELATETAHEYAERNSLCSEFDRCMVEIGLRPRRTEYVVTLTYSVTVTASDEDDAVDVAASELGVVYVTPDDVAVEESSGW